MDFGVVQYPANSVTCLWRLGDRPTGRANGASFRAALPLWVMGYTIGLTLRW